MKKILTVIRFLPQDGVALQFAANAAYQQGAALLLLLPYGPASEDKKGAQAEGQRQAIATDALIKFAQQHLQHTHLQELQISYQVGEGQLDELVTTYWKKEGIDLIVVSAYGREFSFESDTALPMVSILRGVNCPLLLIPERSQYTGWQQIVFKAQLQFKDVLALSLLSQWTRQFGGTVHCFHFLSGSSNREQAEWRLNIIQSALSRLDLINFEIQSGTFRSRYRSLAEALQADILAMVTPAIHSWAGRNNLKQIAELLEDSALPLLLMKDIDNLARFEREEEPANIVPWSVHKRGVGV